MQMLVTSILQATRYMLMSLIHVHCCLRRSSTLVVMLIVCVTYTVTWLL